MYVEKTLQNWLTLSKENTGMKADKQESIGFIWGVQF